MGQQENNSKGLTRVGGVVLAAGVILTVGFGWIVFFRHLIDDREVPLFIKIGIPAIFLGALILLVVVIRDRIKHRKNEGLQEVKW